MFTLRLLVLAAASVAVLGSPYHPERAARPSRARARVNPAELTAKYWVDQAQAAVEEKARNSFGSGKARNIVFFMGDGMSVPTLAAARTLLGQRNGHTGEEATLSFESFPTVGLQKTYCVNVQVPDSGCTASAMLTGVKTNEGVLGLTAAVQRRDCLSSLNNTNRLQTLADWALADGRDVGVVTTTRITHASPGSVYAKTADRNWENNAAVEMAGFETHNCPDTAHQLVNMHPANKFKVVLGGGRREFIPNTVFDEEGFRGRRSDRRNLINEWEADKTRRNATHTYAWNREQLMSVFQNPPEYLLGLFESNHMQFHMQANKNTEPTLVEMTEIAIRSLMRNEKGFFLFIESGRIDHGHHGNNVHLALDETIELSKAVARAKEMLSEEDSLIVVTADHAHVMSFNGYSERGADVLGVSDDVDRNNVPYMTLSYTNGPGARTQLNGIRRDPSADANFGNPDWATHAEVPLVAETHGADDVGVFAWGPHHDMFSGLYEQNHLPHLMAYAGCIGPGRQACAQR